MLYKNDVFEIPASNFRGRLLTANSATDEAWIISLDDAKAWPRMIQLSQLLAMEEAGRLSVSAMPVTPSSRASRVALSHRDTAWQRIVVLVSSPAIFEPDERNRLIRERAQSIKCSHQTLYSALRKYWQGGQTRDALLPAFHKRGGKAGFQTAGKGRKSTKSGHDIFQVEEKDVKSLEKAIRTHFLGSDVATMASAYQRCLEDHYSYVDGNGARYVLPLGDRPTLRQFTRILKKKFDLETVIRKKKSDKEFEQNHRARLGSMDQDCLGVGHIYEIDATIADVFLVFSRDRSRIIGKPTLYLIYDRRSRLVVGFYVGLEAPSWPAAMEAILSIAQNKASLCRRYGVEYNPADWPADGVFPQEFLGDRGEMASKNSSLLVAGLDITVVNAPALRPDLKGTVECGFKLLQRSMADVVPGYEPPENVFKRRGKSYSNDACLTLDEFTSLILANIVAHNRKVMPNFPATAEMLSRGAPPIPREIWANEVATRMGLLSRFSEDHVRFALLPQDQATVSRDGIYFGGCYYSCPEAIEQKWFVTAGKGKFRIDISYDRRLIDNIFIHVVGDPSRYFVGTLLEKSRNYAGLSFAEVQVYEAFRAKMQSESEQNGRQVMSDFHAHSDPIVAAAKEKTQLVTKGKSRTARKADIAEDRFEERRDRRQKEADMSSTFGRPEGPTAQVIPLPTKSSEPAQPATPQGQPTLADKLRRKQQEMLNELKP
ncbi:MAG: Mu transposase C-terminal domain-containing protein [Thiobacillus sp.]|nr:Mu transposase C-terminal domain-containing protein [Thiobacillus sp.]